MDYIAIGKIIIIAFIVGTILKITNLIHIMADIFNESIENNKYRKYIWYGLYFFIVASFIYIVYGFYQCYSNPCCYIPGIRERCFESPVNITNGVLNLTFSEALP
jgi:hypothetical protein